MCDPWLEDIWCHPNMYKMADHIPHSLDINLVLSSTPTPSPSYTVCCHCVPSWCCSSDLTLPYLYKMAAASILPSIPEPSMNTLTSGMSWFMFMIALSSLFVMFITTFGVHLVLKHMASIVSMFCGCILYLCMRSCSRVVWCFTSLFTAFMTGL
jgi:hypothetical protein